jgi:hypothetical protein
MTRGPLALPLTCHRTLTKDQPGKAAQEAPKRPASRWSGPLRPGNAARAVAGAAAGVRATRPTAEAAVQGELFDGGQKERQGGLDREVDAIRG